MTAVTAITLLRIYQLQEDDSCLQLGGMQSQEKLNFAASGKRLCSPEPCSLVGTAAAPREEEEVYFGMVHIFPYP